MANNVDDMLNMNQPQRDEYWRSLENLMIQTLLNTNKKNMVSVFIKIIESNSNIVECTDYFDAGFGS